MITTTSQIADLIRRTGLNCRLARYAVRKSGQTLLRVTVWYREDKDEMQAQLRHAGLSFKPDGPRSFLIYLD